ncbi:Uncharacterised protein [Neisseria meningitidis]|nr:Uncharacterised protein [Neisseria meningitidis]CWP92814.1 Uncharacterised protein [Neisseria meningitidis]CWQ45122.1 Uncharacterised protein [Neisseria meningitidis]CWS23182.1 Uncharacterised protein [Neisseria meningitidis]CWS38414.1 Uncharacterised protein [Neisseria meningitidis]
MGKQAFAVAAVLCLRRDGKAGDFAAIGFGKGFQGGATVQVAVVFEDGKFGNVVFEVFAAAVQQDALFFQRADEGGNVRDVAAVRLPDGDEGFFGNGRADAVAGEEFLQQAAVGGSVEDLDAMHAAFERGNGGRNQPSRFAAGVFRQRLRFLCREGFGERAVGAGNAV